MQYPEPKSPTPTSSSLIASSSQCNHQHMSSTEQVVRPASSYFTASAIHVLKATQDQSSDSQYTSNSTTIPCTGTAYGGLAPLHPPSDAVRRQKGDRDSKPLASLRAHASALPPPLLSDISRWIRDEMPGAPGKGQRRTRAVPSRYRRPSTRHASDDGRSRRLCTGTHTGAGAPQPMGRGAYVQV